MNFEHKYSGSSSVSSTANRTGMSFAPDTLREPTYFVGKLGRKIPFREAISALHDVVVLDLRRKLQDRTAYDQWLKEQEPIWLAELVAEKANIQEQVNQINQQLSHIRKEKNSIMSSFYTAQRAYFQWLYNKNRDWWFVLDPVITVHPDEIFFECFSQDESAYGRLGCSFEVFDQIDQFACGTTNVDYSDALYAEFQKIRNYKETELSVDPSGFDVSTTGEDDYKEIKIDLPDTWVRGFLQVSSAMTLPAVSFDLHPMDVHNFCFILKRRKEIIGPRSIRFILKPGEPVKAIFEPWNQEITCHRSIYKGDKAHEIRIWGRRRLLVLERLIPMAQSFKVVLLGSGMPSFYIANLGYMTFTLGLSGWTANDWSRMGQFDLMAPRADVDSQTAQTIFNTLHKDWFLDANSLATKSGFDRATVQGAMSLYIQSGRVMYDIHKEVYRIRELSREELPLSSLRFANEREAAANQLVDCSLVEVKAQKCSEGIKMTGKVEVDGKVYEPSLIVDKDERIIQAKCSCSFYGHNKLHKGPCEHILSLRIAHNRRT